MQRSGIGVLLALVAVVLLVFALLGKTWFVGSRADETLRVASGTVVICTQADCEEVEYTGEEIESVPTFAGIAFIVVLAQLVSAGWLFLAAYGAARRHAGMINLIVQGLGLLFALLFAKVAVDELASGAVSPGPAFVFHFTATLLAIGVAALVWQRPPRAHYLPPDDPTVPKID